MGSLVGCGPADAFPTIFIEQLGDGPHVVVRECNRIGIRSVSVYRYGSPDGELPIWSAKLDKSRQSEPGRIVALFNENANYEVTELMQPRQEAIYDVLVNEGSQAQDGVTFTFGGLEVGRVDYGNAASVSRPEYDALPDSRFGC